MSRKIFALSLGVGFFAVALAAWRTYVYAYRAQVNHRFCLSIQEFEKERNKIFDSFEDVQKNTFTLPFFKEDAAAPYCNDRRIAFAKWSELKPSLNPMHQQVYSALAEGPKDSLKCLEVQSCEALPESNWTMRLPPKVFESIPKYQPPAAFVVARAQKKLTSLRALIPEIEKQLSDDSTTVCAAALALQRSQKVEEFYLSRCTKCEAKQDYKRLHHLTEQNKSTLQENLAQFRVKWTDTEIEKLSCLKGLTDEIDQAHDDTTRALHERSGFNQ